AHIYQRYAATGAYQAQHDLFPTVVWVVPSEPRRSALEAAFASDKHLRASLFQIVTRAAFTTLVARGHQPDTNNGNA
ncbi:MAG: hypothetical protein M3548_15615, partial [Actinomycetota bacterium]|nr:hypothetical protein [Actinomycetota bacterium]